MLMEIRLVFSSFAPAPKPLQTQFYKNPRCCYNHAVPNRTDSLWRALTKAGTLTFIAGPCVIESEELCLQVARTMKKLCDGLAVNYIFKASYDKANRTSAKSFRGPGLEEGLRVLEKVRDRVGVPVLTDVHTAEQTASASTVADILQIPAFLCRQTDLITAAAQTGRIVN